MTITNTVIFKFITVEVFVPERSLSLNSKPEETNESVEFIICDSEVSFANSRGNGGLSFILIKKTYLLKKSSLGNLRKSEFHLQWFYSCKHHTPFHYGRVCCRIFLF